MPDPRLPNPNPWRLHLADLGMIPVLFALCGLFSILTWAEQFPTGSAAGKQMARAIASELPGKANVLIIVQETAEDAELAEALSVELKAHGLTVAGVSHGNPQDARQAILTALAAGTKIDRLACTNATAQWTLYQSIPAVAQVRIVTPRPYHFPNFLKTDNLLNIANQIAGIAIIAAGMTVVIITGGIDLSVGSLVALASVVTAYLIRGYAGGVQATTFGMIWASLAAILACSIVGLFSGSMITLFRVPPFIATLAMMQVASGLAFRISNYQTIAQVPDRFIWLGLGADLFRIPNAVVLMVLLYLAAHVVMSRMTPGRYIYAVGGNPEAARLSGVPVQRILLLAYVLSGALAGLSGVVLASRLKSGSPRFGEGDELRVIAAVVVGGTSLSGGRGTVAGTLIGAFIIAVISNGMNLIGLRNAEQMIVLGLVILAAVIVDQLRRT